MTYERFHPDGAVAQRGAKDLVKDVWIGTMRWERQAAASPEDVYFPQGAHEAVRAYELVLDDDGYIVEERCYSRNGEPLTSTGAPLPARPEGVPPHAFLTSGDQLWLAQARRDWTRQWRA